MQLALSAISLADVFVVMMVNGKSLEWGFGSKTGSAEWSRAEDDVGIKCD